jgi:hypothetical protein
MIAAVYGLQVCLVGIIKRWMLIFLQGTCFHHQTGIHVSRMDGCIPPIVRYFLHALGIVLTAIAAT